jgi:Uma2 family endonuclease
MAEAGILGPQDRVELIQGQIVEKAVIGSPHAWSVDSLNRLLAPAVGDRAIVRVHGPVRIDDYSEPEPDLLLLRPASERYHSSHPLPADVLLVIEVADTTALFDRSVKLPLYALAGIPEYWLVDVRRQVVEIYRSPEGGAYADAREARAGTPIAPEAFPDIVLDAGQILSP